MRNTINRTGEENINNQGLKMWIKDYRGNKDIDIEFEDGFIVYNRAYGDFKKGKAKNPNFFNKTGEINNNAYGSKMTIVQYYNSKNIIVEFENNYKVKCTYKQFKKGEIKSPYDKTVCGIGYLGEGFHEASINKKHTKQYIDWKAILFRCYNDYYLNKHKTYTDCIVCEEWLCYQNFAKWWHENHYEIEGQQMQVDKDILHKGNKIYSPENCIFVPQDINKLFTKSDALRGEYPIGVSLNKENNKFSANCNAGHKKRIFLGYFNTFYEAFCVYKKFKEKYIKKVADYYKDKIPNKLYKALYSYEVEITD